MLNKELQLGLQAKPERPSVFPMINTFVTQLPNGTEIGDFLGLDIGGTGLRIVYLSLRKINDGKFEKKIELESYDVPVNVRQGEGKVVSVHFVHLSPIIFICLLTVLWILCEMYQRVSGKA